MTVTSHRWSDTVRTVLASRFDLHERLGSGSFATVWRVTNRSLGRVEALKVLAERHGEDAELVRRFTREAQIAAALDHPNVVRVYEFGVTDGILWYSMELVDGPTLQSEIQRGRNFGEAEVVEILVQVLAALEVIHAAGVVHRDVKPANIVLDANGVPHVMDFGIAKIDGGSGATHTGTMMGTPAYAAPELLRGERPDGRSDLFAVGVVAFEMLSGRLPYLQADSAQQLLARRLVEQPLAIREVAPAVSPTLAGVITRAMAASPAARFDRPAAFAEALRAAIADPAPLDRLEVAPRGRSRAAAGALAVAAVLGLIAVGLGAVVRERFTAPQPLPAPARVTDSVLGLGTGSVGSEKPSPGQESSEDLTTASSEAPADLAAKDEPAPAPETAPSPSPPAPGPDRAVPASPAPQPESVLRRPVVFPVALETPQPELPAELVEVCAGTSLPFVLDVDEAGRVSGARALRVGETVDPRCLGVAEEALRRYTFRPALDAGKAPVPARISIAVAF